MRHWFAKSEAFAVSAEPNHTRPHLFGLESIQGPCMFGWGVEALVATFPPSLRLTLWWFTSAPAHDSPGAPTPQRGHFGKSTPVTRGRPDRLPPCADFWTEPKRMDSNVSGPLTGPEGVDEVLYRVPRLGEGRSRCCLVLSWLSVLAQARHTCAPN